MPTIKLTDLAVRALRPHDTPTMYFDTQMRGFFLRVGKNTKTWGVMQGSRTRIRVKIGTFPAMNVQQARRAALGLKDGPQPSQPTVTFPDARTLFLANYSGKDRGKGTQRDIVRGSRAHQRAYDGKHTLRPATSKKMEGIKPKDLIGIPWRVAFALQADGWYLRQDIIWHKPNPMPESVTDRCTKAHEYIFLLSKSQSYYFDHEAIKEEASGRIAGNKVHQKGVGERFAETKSGLLAAQQKPFFERNKRSVWTVTTKPYKGAHFATFPPDLIEPCILAGCPKNFAVLDPFMGSGTTGEVALKHGRDFIGIELNPTYMELAQQRLGNVTIPMLAA